ncbi:MAG: hypothetical protein ACM3WU_10590 [Bacillota bacterium]
MKPRILRIVLVSGMLTIMAASVPSWAPAWMRPSVASLAPAAPASPPPAPDETAVYQAIRSSVKDLQTALHRKVASTLVHKVSSKAAGASYESTWLVTVRYWLDYAKPDEVPYLKGMQKCLTEFGGTSDREWLAWAQAQLSRVRSQYAEEIAFQQEAKLDVFVAGTLDETGNPSPPSLKVFQMTGNSEALPMSAEILAAPSDRQMEQAGYYYLKDRLDGQSQSSGSAPGSASPEQSGATPGGSGAPQPQQESSQDPKASQSQTTSPSSTSGSSSGGARKPVDANSRILFTGIAVLFALIIILALNQYLLARSKR